MNTEKAKKAMTTARCRERKELRPAGCAASLEGSSGGGALGGLIVDLGRKRQLGTAAQGSRRGLAFTNRQEIHHTVNVIEAQRLSPGHDRPRDPDFHTARFCFPDFHRIFRPVA